MSTNLKVAHLVNPYKCAEDNPSYLYYAQPITFRSMYEAKLFAESKGVQVELVAANFLEDDEIVPDYFTKLPNLTKSTQTVFPDISGDRKLPIIQEMLDSVCTHTDADIIVFTNTDVGVQRSFYVDIHNMVVRDGLKSFIINRRDGLPKYVDGKRLTEEHLDILYKEKGVKHPGKDCFIMRREIATQVQMGNMFTGYPPWGYVLHSILQTLDEDNMLFADLFLTFHIGSDRSWQSKVKHKLWEQNIKESRTLEYIVQEEARPRRSLVKRLLTKLKWT